MRRKETRMSSLVSSSARRSKIIPRQRGTKLNPVCSLLPRVLLAVFLSVCTACKNPLPAPTYTVTARLANSADVPHDDSLQIAYTGAASSTTRLVAKENMGFTFLQTAGLSLARGGTAVPGTDAYYLQVIS